MSIEEKIAGIHDPDLRAEIEAARGGFLFAQIVEHVLHRQREREHDKRPDAHRRVFRRHATRGQTFRALV